MNKIDLKLYTTRAKELEVAIHTQRNLMKSYDDVIKAHIPTKPTMESLPVPKKPKKPNEPKSTYKLPIGQLLLAIGLIIIFFCLWFSCITSDDRHIGVQFMEIIYFVLMAIGGIGMYTIVKENIQMTEKFEQEKAKFEEDMISYPKRLEEYKINYQKQQEKQQLIAHQYDIEYDAYLKNLNQYNENYTQISNNHKNAYRSLVNALDDLYSEDIIYPKYRNLVAISAINEYLMSGRCDKLEGPDGAYNLYEMELRQNIIIGQLSSIINNIEQIRNNQYSLYQELQKSNYTINEILNETRSMSETTKLTAYFAGVTALVESSPKHYYGVIM